MRDSVRQGGDDDSGASQVKDSAAFKKAGAVLRSWIERFQEEAYDELDEEDEGSELNAEEGG